MTRKEAFNMAKRYGISLLISLPILFVVDFFLLGKILNVWIVVIDAVIIVLVYIFWLLISQSYKNHITRKRTEFLHNKEKLEKEKKEQERLLKEQEQKQEEQEQKPKKIIQKQKRNYKNNKSKKHKKK